MCDSARATDVGALSLGSVSSALSLGSQCALSLSAVSSNAMDVSSFSAVSTLGFDSAAGLPLSQLFPPPFAASRSEFSLIHASFLSRRATPYVSSQQNQSASRYPPRRSTVLHYQIHAKA